MYVHTSTQILYCLYIYTYYIHIVHIQSADNEALRTLDLSWNHIRKKGAVAVATSLKVHTVGINMCTYVHACFHM